MSGGYRDGRPPTELAGLIERLDRVDRRLDVLERPAGDQLAQTVAQLAARGAWAATSPALTNIGPLAGAVGLTWGAATASLVVDIPKEAEGVCLITMSGALDLSVERTAGGNGGALSAHVGYSVNGVTPAVAVDTLEYSLAAPPVAGSNLGRLNASRTVRRTFTPGTNVAIATIPGWSFNGAVSASAIGYAQIFNYALVVQLVR